MAKNTKENIIDGIVIDPQLSPNFYCTDNELRDPQEIHDWWKKPYIHREFRNNKNNQSYEDYCINCQQVDEFIPEPKEKYEKSMVDWKLSWHTQWPEGIRYDVKFLDGGAWDRPTNRGSFPTLEEALVQAKKLLSN